MSDNQKRAEKQHLNRLLEIPNPIEHFETRGVSIYQRVNIQPDVIRETIDILKGAFSEEWLVSQTKNKSQGDMVPLCDHPLGHR